MQVLRAAMMGGAGWSYWRDTADIRASRLTFEYVIAQQFVSIAALIARRFFSGFSCRHLPPGVFIRGAPKPLGQSR